MASQAVDAVGLTGQSRRDDPPAAESDLRPKGRPRPLSAPKVLAESAMLLRSIEPLQAQHIEIAGAAGALTRKLVTLRETTGFLAGIVATPPFALARAALHIHLSALGHPDVAIDRFLTEILSDEPAGGPELLPTELLERAWLAELWSGVRTTGPDPELLSASCLGRPLDALWSNPPDLYAFTHALLYASDIGRRTIFPPRSSDEILEDAEAALAAAIDADNFDLAAELLWAWPMLRRPWSPGAEFCYSVLAAVQDEHRFLPSPAFSSEAHAVLTEPEASLFVLETSYHATLVMGLLCSMMLRWDPTPGVEVVADRHPPDDGVDQLYALLGNKVRPRRWQEAFLGVDARLRGRLGGFIFTIAVRRAAAMEDIDRVRDCLRVASDRDVAPAPAPRQALAYLRRAIRLSEVLGRSLINSTRA